MAVWPYNCSRICSTWRRSDHPAPTDRPLFRRHASPVVWSRPPNCGRFAAAIHSPQRQQIHGNVARQGDLTRAALAGHLLTLTPKVLATALITWAALRCGGAASNRTWAVITVSVVSAWPVRSEKGQHAGQRPSSSRTFDCTCRATASNTLPGMLRPARSAWTAEWQCGFRGQGGWISPISPHSKRERRRSSSVTSALGGRSDEMMICFFLAVECIEGMKELFLGLFLCLAIN